MPTEQVVRKRLANLEARALADLAAAGVKANALEGARAGFFPQDIFAMMDSANDRTKKKGQRLAALISAVHFARNAIDALERNELWLAMDKAISAAIFAYGPDSVSGADQREAQKSGGKRRTGTMTLKARAMAANLPKSMGRNAKARVIAQKLGMPKSTAERAVDWVIKTSSK